MEPPNLWVDRVDNRLKDRAPRVIEGEGKALVYAAICLGGAYWLFTKK